MSDEFSGIFGEDCLRSQVFTLDDEFRSRLKTHRECPPGFKRNKQKEIAGAVKFFREWRSGFEGNKQKPHMQKYSHSAYSGAPPIIHIIKYLKNGHPVAINIDMS